MTDIVVDVGCASWGTETSIRPLIDRYAPRILFGFDPAPNMFATRRHGFVIGGTRVEILNQAAWLYDGEARFFEGGTRGTLVVPLDDEGDTGKVECVDLARWLDEMGERVVMKVDIEGGEYPLIGRLLSSGAVRWVEHMLVEWHRVDNPILAHERDLLTANLLREGVTVEEWH